MRKLTNNQWEQVEALLPAGARITKTYTAFENGETRIVVQLPDAQFETRYIIHFECEDVRLEHRP